MTWPNRSKLAIFTELKLPTLDPDTCNWWILRSIPALLRHLRTAYPKKWFADRLGVSTRDQLHVNVTFCLHLFKATAIFTRLRKIKHKRTIFASSSHVVEAKKHIVDQKHIHSRFKP